MTISGDILLFFLGLLALILMGMSNRSILFALSSSMLWFVLFMWLFFSSSPPLILGETWVDILAWVFLVLVFVPWIVRWDVEIRNEARGKRWTEYGQKPKEKRSSNYEEYRDELRRRTRR